MKAKLIAFTAALFAAGTAQAAEVQGPWIEARAGWDSLDGTSGLLYGGAIGYDFAVSDKIFLGLQAGLAGSTAEECEFGVCANVGRDIEVLARLGGSVGSKTSLYALAGYANSRFGGSFEGLELGTNLSGFRAGAGVEQAFGGNTYGKLEYRFTAYGDGDLAGEPIEGGNRHQLSASFGIRF
jgi:outer membrane immunogenic protein